MPKSRIFLFLLLAFIGGAAIRSFLYIPVIFIWIVVVSAAIVIVWGVGRKQKEIILYGFLAIMVALGISRFSYLENSHPDLSPYYDKHFTLNGVVWEEVELSEKIERLKIKIGIIEGRKIAPPFYVLAAVRKYPVYFLGDELIIRGVIEKPQNYGEFDYVSYLARREIFGTISFPEIEKIGEGKGSKIKIILSLIKRAFEENIDRALPEPHGTFLKGILLGERSSLPPELMEKFERTGTTHIIALSGYNITIVGRSFMEFLLFLTIPFQISFWIAVSAITLFIILVGASPSVTRAGILGILVLIAQREGRLYSIRNALVFAGAAMVFHNPLILRFNAAFQLSFLATLGLIYLSPHVEKFLGKIRYKFKRLVGGTTFVEKHQRPEDMEFWEQGLFKLKRIFIESVSAQLAVLPLLIYLFGRISLVSPLANILVLVVVPYSMAAGFITGLMGFFGESLSQIFGWISWILLEYKILVIKFFAKFSYSAVSVSSNTVFFILAALYLLTLLRLLIKGVTAKDNDRNN